MESPARIKLERDVTKDPGDGAHLVSGVLAS